MQSIPSYYKTYRYNQDIANGDILTGKCSIKTYKDFLDMIKNKDSK